MERRGPPGGVSEAGVVACSFRPGELCGWSTRRVRGRSLFLAGCGEEDTASGLGSAVMIEVGRGGDEGVRVWVSGVSGFGCSGGGGGVV